MMRTYQHWPWRELFFDDRPEGPALIYRPSPWLDREGSPIQIFTETVETIDLTYADVIAWDLARTDEHVLNYFFVYPSTFAAFATMVKSSGSALESFYAPNFLRSNPHLVGHGAGTAEVEGDFRRHGFRLHEVYTPYFDWPHDAREAEIRAALPPLIEQGVEATQRMRRAMDHGALLETGTLTLKGDERITLGTYLNLDGARYYVEAVTHRFRQGTGPHDGHFYTTAHVTGGRGHLVRTGLGAG